MLYEVITAGVVLACDVIYASEKAKFSEIYANIGMVPDCGNLWLLPRIVGPQKAKELCFRITSYNVCYTKLLRFIPINNEI